MTQTTTNLKKTITYFLVVALTVTLFIPQATKAQTFKKEAPSGVEIKYLGTQQDQLIFGLTFKNEQSEAFQITIKDSFGNSVFSEKYQTKNFSKKFLFNKDEFGDAELTFVINTGKKQQAEVFTLNKSTRIIEDVVVTRNK